jgi:phosphoserine phosphatase
VTVGATEPAPTRPGVAAFDFDKTLARCDTFLPFLRQACGNRRVALAAAAAARTSRASSFSTMVFSFASAFGPPM